MNLSLYFNCKLTGSQLVKVNRNSEYVTPVMYPINALSESKNQFEILLKSIKSYSKINFETVIFNIDLGEKYNSKKDQITKVIQNHINYRKKIQVNFERPSNSIEWINSYNEAEKFIGKQNPILVVMNHDHLFVDSDSKYLNLLVNKVFSNNNSHSLLAYSHIPELISESVNNKEYEYSKIFMKYNSLSKNVAAVFIMKINTLKLFLPLKNSKGYIGRLIDWNYKRNKAVNVNYYIPLKELFKHYDGYLHVTSNNMVSDLRLKNNGFNVNNSENVILEQYQIWLDTYYLFLRDFYKKNKFNDNKTKLRKAIDISYDLFVKNEIEYKGILSNTKLSDQLYSHIYNNFFEIFLNVDLENKLLHRTFFEKIINKLRKWLD